MTPFHSASKAMVGRGGQSNFVAGVAKPYQVQVRSPLGAWRDQGPASFNATQAISRFERLLLSPGYQARLLRGTEVIRSR